MLVCSKLGKDEKDIAHWEYADLVRWAAFFRLEGRLEAEAIKRAKGQEGNSSGSTTTIFD